MFDDVNEVTIHNKEYLLYPHQIKIVANSDLKAFVLNSYFKGSYWLIEAEVENKIVFLQHDVSLERNLKVNIALKKNHLNSKN